MGRPRNFEAGTVVERAMEQFWTSGYAGTSPAQLADAVGVGKGRLYNTFGSKRQLFHQALARYGRLGAEFAEESCPGPGPHGYASSAHTCAKRWIRMSRSRSGVAAWR